jgi:signal transduction histidine kinase
MRKSFKLRLFIQIFLACGIVILANRQIAQYFLSTQLTDRVHLQMGQALQRCSQHFSDPSEYLLCNARLDQGNLTAWLADHHVLCPALIEGQIQEAACRVMRENTASWSREKSGLATSIEVAQRPIENDDWVAVRQAGQAQGPMILLAKSNVSQFQAQIWSLRDRNLVYVLPVILTMLLLVTWYMAHVALRPIRQLEKSMSDLTLENLTLVRVADAEFREFQSFVAIYQDLRTRLNESFVKARRFAGDVSHELRTPLTILRGHAEQWIRQLPVGSDAQVQVRVISDEIERLIDIVERLLLLSRADANSIKVNMQALNFSQAITQMIGESHGFQSNVTFSGQIEPNIVWHCDRQLVGQLLQNLYTNAVNYNLPGGWVKVVLTRESNALRLTVENPTRELTDEMINRAFERFYRGAASHNRTIDGQGLGLSLSLEIAKVHQGQLSVERTAEHTFKVSLTAPLNPTLA